MYADESALSTLPTSAFSVVLAIEVLMCVNHPDQVLADLRERLRPGGVLIAHVPVRSTSRPHERTLFTDVKLYSLFEQAGFNTPDIHQTFGIATQILCRIFSALVTRPTLLALMYPWLLLGITLAPPIVRKGSYRLVVARRPVEEHI